VGSGGVVWGVVQDVLGQDLLCTVAVLKVQDGLKTRSASEAGGKDRDEMVFILRE